MMNYTDAQLKAALAKMLPTLISYDAALGLCYIANSSTDGFRIVSNVLDTELLHLCWLVEETLSDIDLNEYVMQWNSLREYMLSTWQQRVIALAEVKGIKI